MRSPHRRRPAVLAALVLGALVTAGCGGGKAAPDAKPLYFQPVTAKGPDPFTPTTADDLSDPTARPPGGANGPGARAARARTLPGDTPGLYAAAKGLPSCDVDRQIDLLTRDRATARAFARGAGIAPASVPAFLRGLTPVMLRADTRVTDQGRRPGASAPTAYQAVLQAGTAVMVDGRGMPRVRCTCGNPLRPAVAVQGAVRRRGDPWPGYRPERVAVISRSARPVGGLTVVDVVGHSWIRRATGTDGTDDRAPGTPPSYSTDADLFDPGEVTPPGAVPTPGTDTPEPSGTPAPRPPRTSAPSTAPSGASPDPHDPHVPVTPDAPYPVGPAEPRTTQVGAAPEAAAR